MNDLFIDVQLERESVSRNSRDEHIAQRRTQQASQIRANKVEKNSCAHRHSKGANKQIILRDAVEMSVDTREMSSIWLKGRFASFIETHRTIDQTIDGADVLLLCVASWSRLFVQLTFCTSNRAQCFLNLNMFNHALRDCETVLRLSERHHRAMLIQGSSLYVTTGSICSLMKI